MNIRVSTMEKHRFERTPTVRELIMALRKVGNHEALVKIEALRATGSHQDICSIELTEHGGGLDFVYLCIGDLPVVSYEQRQAERL